MMSVILKNENSSLIDFKVIPVPLISEVSGDKIAVTNYRGLPEELRVASVQAHTIGAGDFPGIEWYQGDLDDGSSTAASTFVVLPNVWYTLQVDWKFKDPAVLVPNAKAHIWLRDDPSTVLWFREDFFDFDDPYAYVKHFCGFFGNDNVTYELVIDNAQMQVHCHAERPPVVEWLAWPDSVEFSNPSAGFMSGVDGGFGMDIFKDGVDLGFAEGHAGTSPGFTYTDMHFTTPKGPGGLSLSDLAIELHLQAWDDTGVADKEHRVHLQLYSTNEDILTFGDWEISLPDQEVHSNGILIGPKVSGTLGSIVYPSGTDELNHWWSFQNRSSSDWSTDGTDNDDPFPSLMNALAEGSLVARVWMSNFLGSGATADSYVRVFEFTIGPA